MGWWLPDWSSSSAESRRRPRIGLPPRGSPFRPQRSRKGHRPRRAMRFADVAQVGRKTATFYKTDTAAHFSSSNDRIKSKRDRRNETASGLLSQLARASASASATASALSIAPLQRVASPAPSRPSRRSVTTERHAVEGFPDAPCPLRSGFVNHRSAVQIRASAPISLKFFLVCNN